MQKMHKKCTNVNLLQVALLNQWIGASSIWDLLFGTLPTFAHLASAKGVSVLSMHPLDLNYVSRCTMD